MKIPYGEGWPYPKCEVREGTSYRTFLDHNRDVKLVIALDADGTRRGIEVSGMVLDSVLRPRSKGVEQGTSLWGDEDAETLLQAPEAWSTTLPLVPLEYTMADADALAWDMAYRLDDEWGDHVSKHGGDDKDIAAGQRRIMALSWHRDWNGVRTRWTSVAASCLNGMRCERKWPERTAPPNGKAPEGVEPK
jgi:hypothetical protein